VVLALFVVAYVLAISAHPLRWERWVIPVLPFVALFAAVGVSALAKGLSQRIEVISHTGWMVAVGAALVLPLLLQTVQQGMNRAGTDTRAQAREWLLANVPAKSKVLIEAYGPQAPKVPKVPKDHCQLYNAGGEQVLRRPQGLRSHVIPSGFLSEGGTLEALAAEGVEYVVLSSFYERFKGMNHAEVFAMVDNYETVLKLPLPHTPEASAVVVPGAPPVVN
jgi:hypothetical protein